MNKIKALSKDEAKDRIDALTQELNRHSYLYYALDRPEIPDEAYDTMLRELQVLEEAFPDLKTAGLPHVEGRRSPHKGVQEGCP